MEDAANKASRIIPWTSAWPLLRRGSPRPPDQFCFRVELPFIDGDRIDAEGVRSYMAKGNFSLPMTPQALPVAFMSNFVATAATWACSASTPRARAPASAEN